MLSGMQLAYDGNLNTLPSQLPWCSLGYLCFYSCETGAERNHPEILLRAPTSENPLALGLPVSVCGAWAHVLGITNPNDFLFQAYFPSS